MHLFPFFFSFQFRAVAFLFLRVPDALPFAIEIALPSIPHRMTA
jgi:hypothetical protein